MWKAAEPRIYICKHAKQHVKHFTPIENRYNENIESLNALRNNINRPFSVNTLH